ncbi:phage tail tip lysozyme [Pseudomonas fragi]|uniref:phage tail tip lysozyme n=1 Tax=Pseudomonas fragi TaxID=296 RepID=UPI001F34E48E|nr:phage tail tip lysozyme [Pseudomonas fragi]
MANTFSITISAVDKATATVRRVNDSISRLTRPFQDVGKSFKSLGRELGFEKIGKNLGTIGREASGAARSIGSIIAPMAAVTGLGSVAGIAVLAKNWANLSRSIDGSSHSIGISSGQLQSFQGAAQMVGVEASATTSSLDGLANTMQDAQWGRNQGALLMFNKLGIGLKKTKDGTWDVVAQYKAVASAIAKEASPQRQKLIARAFGMENMLPFLRQGAAGIERYEAMVKRLGYVMGDDAVKRGKAFSLSLAGLGVVIDGVKNSIGDALIPAMKPLIDQFSLWLAANRELIATDIGNWAKGFATWINKIDWKEIGDGIVKFGKGIGDVVKWLGGWENAAILVAIAMNAGLIGGVLMLGTTLLSAGAGILGYIGLLTRMGTAATLAGGAAATAAAGMAGASAAGLGAGVAGAAGAAGAGAAGVIGASIGAGLGAFLVGLGTLVYSPSLNAGEDDIVRKRRIAQGLPAVDPSEVLGSIWKKQGGLNEDLVKHSMDYFQGQGWSRAHAAGITANLGLESNFDPAAKGDNGRAYGIAQWHDYRQQQFAKWAGKPIQNSSLEEQLRFVQYELTQGGEKKAGDLLRATTTARQAGDIVSRQYERPADSNGDAAKRAAVAEYLDRGNPTGMPAAPQAKDTPVAPGLSAPLSKAPEGPYSSGVQNQGGKVQVNIEHANAPEGMKVNAKAEGNVEVSSRVAYSGVGAIA